MKLARLHTLSALTVPLTLGLLAPMAGWKQEPSVTDPTMRTLMVGGGPDKKHNQVAIESNVRYVSKLLPQGSKLRVLFTDGSLDSVNVQVLDADNHIAYRAPQLPRLDGPSEFNAVQAELNSISKEVEAKPSLPVLLYFTGHGGPDEASGYNNNQYDLWKEGEFTVHDMAQALKKFPKKTPIALVMVECFSGAFGNVIFEDGDPTGALADHNLCGFFASVPQREAAGCTPEINEAEYKDFTGYFFAALMGTDRMGRSVSGADYNHDGRVGMNEAYDYSLLHDESIDTPVCTSDTFLRRFVKTSDPEVFANKYSDVQSWASPGQLAALDGLAKDLSLSGDGRLKDAFDEFSGMRMDSMRMHDVKLLRFVRLAKSVVLAHTLETSGDKGVRSRYHDLIKAEGGNVLKP